MFFEDKDDPEFECPFCGANMWLNGRVNRDNKEIIGYMFNMCCLQGNVVLPQVNDPPPFLKSHF